MSHATAYVRGKKFVQAHDGSVESTMEWDNLKKIRSPTGTSILPTRVRTRVLPVLEVQTRVRTRTRVPVLSTGIPVHVLQIIILLCFIIALLPGRAISRTEYCNTGTRVLEYLLSSWYDCSQPVGPIWHTVHMAIWIL